MNFDNTSLSQEIKNQLSTLSTNESLPHAILITGGSENEREEIVKLLCHYAVCERENKPCYNCSHCHKATTLSHPDITLVKGSEKTKTKIYNKDIIEEVIRTASIIPNEAKSKVYVLKDVDDKLPPISQNAFLKTLEEPPKNVVFIMTCKDGSKMLETVLSRCTQINIPLTENFSDEGMAIAEEIVLSLNDVNEYSLLKATYKLKNKEISLSVLPPLKMLFRDALMVTVGAEQTTKSEAPKKLKRKLTREKALALIETIDRATSLVHSNANHKLLATWLCAELRRIIWQK